MRAAGCGYLQAYNGALRDVDLHRLAEALRDSSLCVIPTGSRYALSCGVESPKAVERLLRIPWVRETLRAPFDAELDKGRASLFLLCASLGQAALYLRVEDSHFALLRQDRTARARYLMAPRGRLARRVPSRRACPLQLSAEGSLPNLLAQMLSAPLLCVDLPVDPQAPERARDPSLIAEDCGHLASLLVDDGILEPVDADLYDCTGPSPVLIAP